MSAEKLKPEYKQPVPRNLVRPSCVEVFGKERLARAEAEVREAIWCGGDITIVEDAAAQTVAVRLLSSDAHWVIDRRRRLVYVAGHDGRPLPIEECFPRIFSRRQKSGSLLFAETSPSTILEKHTRKAARELVKELMRGKKTRRGYSLSCGPISFVRLPPSFRCKDKDLKGRAGWVDSHLLKRTTSAYLTHRLHKMFRDEGAVLVKKMVKTVWALFDREAIRYAVSCRGITADALDLSLVWQNIEGAREAHRIAPGTLPLWLSEQKERARARLCLRGAKAPGKDVPREKILRLGVRRTSRPEVVESVLRGGVGARLTKRGWRWLIARSPVWITAIGRLGYGARAAEFINLMAELSVQPKLSFYRHLIREWMLYQNYGLFGDESRRHTVRLLEAAVRHSRVVRKQDNAGFLVEMSLVIDWWRTEKPALDANQRKAGWDWYVRRQARWHEDAVNRHRASMEGRRWTAPLPTHVEEGWSATALTDGLQLYEEGQRMYHCVADYAVDCQNGFSHIYHVEQTSGDGRLEHATLELSRDESGWYLRQVMGPCNNRVSEECVRFGRRVLAAIAGALRQQAAKAA